MGGIENQIVIEYLMLVKLVGVKMKSFMSCFRLELNAVSSRNDKSFDANSICY